MRQKGMVNWLNGKDEPSSSCKCLSSLASERERCNCFIGVFNPTNSSRKCMEVSPGQLHSQFQGFLDKIGVN